MEGVAALLTVHEDRLALRSLQDPSLNASRWITGRFIRAIQAPSALLAFASVLQALASYLCEVSRVLLETAQYKSRSGADQWLSGVSQIREIGTRRRCTRRARRPSHTPSSARRRAVPVPPGLLRHQQTSHSSHQAAPVI